MRFVCLVCLLGLASSAAAQGARPRPQTVLRDSVTGRIVIQIPVREAGIVDTSFLNQQNPPELGPADAVDLQFQNLSAITDFEVRIGGQVVPLRQSNQNTIALRDVIAAGQTSGTFAVHANGSIIPNGVGYFTVTPAAAPPAPAPAPPAAPVQALSTDPASRTAGATYRTRKTDLLQLPVPGGPPSPALPVGPRSRVVRIPLNGVGVDDWEFRNLRNPPYLLKPNRGDETLAAEWGRQLEEYLKTAAPNDPILQAKIQAEIDKINRELGVAKTAYQTALASTDPLVHAAAKSPENPWVRLALLQATDIEFVNEGVDRTFTITVDIPTPGRIADAKTTYDRDAQRTAFEARSGVKLGDCVAGPPATCKVVINLPFQSPKSLAAQWLAGENAEPLLNFSTWYANINKEQPAVTFSVSFFDENATPAEAAAYVSLVPLSSLREAASKTGWTLSPTIGASRDPLVADTAKFSTEEGQKYPGDLRRQFTGAAKLTLKQTLGSRADATVEFAFKGGPLGEKGYTGTVTTPTYQVNINSVPGLRLSFGKFLFASPANGIALRESGEGFRVSVRNHIAVSHLIKRESVDGVPDTGNRDHRVYLFEANNLAGRQWNSVRSVNLLASFGDDRAPKTKHRYWTAGLDLQFSVPDSPISGTAAYFHSDRTPLGDENDPRIVRGIGNVAFTTVGYTFFKKPTSATQPSRKVAATIRGEWGVGSGDRLATDTRDAGYLGETAAFAPDVFFLSTFAGKLAGIAPRITGLRHKHYFAAIYQEERVTPLDLAAKLLNIPERDIASRLLRAGLRAYYFNGDDIAEGIDQHDAGREFFLESQIETPGGVKSSFAVSYFRPGTAIRNYFKNPSVWSVVSKVTVTLGT